MVVLDEKSMIPPPPYTAAGSVPLPPLPGGRSRQGLSLLPPHLLLNIVYMTFPQTPEIEIRLKRQRKTLYWLAHRLRLVNRSFYIACMHVLRSTYLPVYASLIRAPYSSHPFPLSSSTSPPAGPVETTQRETQVLDLFIVLKVREDVMLDETELHLEREESFKDLFDLMQPRSRLEDLVRYYGVREGLVNSDSPAGSSGEVNRRTAGPSPIPFSMLSVSFSPRRACLALATRSRKRTIVEVSRTRDEELEVTAKKLVRQLKVWLSDA